MNLSSLRPPLSQANSSHDPLGGHRVWEVVLITLVTASLSLVTVIGNILVLLSFKYNQRLKTVNNYFLLSLAYADLIIGVLSMNLYTSYIVMGRWPLGSVACDIWLALDYVASNASVMNLLVISFDRYFSVTRPLTYRAKRTPRKAISMIVLAWSISFILWAPAILFWQYIVGQRVLEPGRCSIQFLSVPIITFCTAMAAFYLPVTIMTVLYWYIYRETKRRTKQLAALQGTGHSSKQAAAGSRHGIDSRQGPSVSEGAQRHSEKDGDSSSLIRNLPLQLCADLERDDSGSEDKAWPDPGTPAAGGKPGSKGTPSPCCLRIQMALTKPDRRKIFSADTTDAAVSVRRMAPGGGESGQELELEERSLANHGLAARAGRGTSPREPDTPPSASLLPKGTPLAACSTPNDQSHVAERKRTIIKETKAAKTLSAILLAFIVTWTPYNIMVLVSAFCQGCVPTGLWHLGYWLCYINSTVNPMCYALCNREFRITFRLLLLCHWDSWKFSLNAAKRKVVPS
ncbi:muscarinic acetylcholine receptor M1-like [Mustelus asterias]